MNQLREWTGICQRCFKKSEKYTMSMLDVSLICEDCNSGERTLHQHDSFPTRKTAELKEMQPGMEWEIE